MPVHLRLFHPSYGVRAVNDSMVESPLLPNSPTSFLEHTKAQLTQIRQPSLKRFIQDPIDGAESTEAELTADLDNIVVRDKLSEFSLWLPISWLQANPSYHVGRDIGNHRIDRFVDGRLKEPEVSANILRWVDQDLNAAESNVRENWGPEKEFVIGMTLDRRVVVIEDHRMDGTMDTITLPRYQILESVYSPGRTVAGFRMLQTRVAEALSQAAPFLGDEPSRRRWLKKPWIDTASLGRWRVMAQWPMSIEIEDKRNGVSYSLPQCLREDPSFDLVEWMRQECWNVYGPLLIEEVYFDESGKLHCIDALANT